MSNQLAFPPHQGLPFQAGPPVVDGYIEPDPGVPISQLEAGYVAGGRYTFAETSGANSSGATTVAFQGIKHNAEDLIYLAWIVRFDFVFNPDSRIICCLRPSFTTPGNERRIDIVPVDTGGAPASPADGNDVNTATLKIRTNKPPTLTPVFYEVNTGAGHPWTALPSGAITNVDVRVRSSEILSGSNVTAQYWSVELQLPTKTSGPQAGGAAWIDLQANFGLYFNVVQVCPAQTAHEVELNGDFCVESAWPDPSFLISDPTSAETPDQWNVPNGAQTGSPSYYGEGIIVAPGSPNPAKGVHFRKSTFAVTPAVEGIGVRSGGPGSVLGTQLDMTLGHANTLAGRVYNDDLNPAPGVFAEFRLADFGLGPYGESALWDKIDIHGPGNPTPPASIPATGPGVADTDLTATWTITQADRNKYGPLWHDQCLWVLLDSAAGASIAESSVRQNLSLINLSKSDHPLTVTGRGHGTPPGGAPHHDFILHVVDVRYQEPVIIEQPSVGRGDGNRLNVDPAPPELNLEPTITGQIAATSNTVTWLHVVNGYRCTGRRIKLGKRRMTIWTHAGACAFVAQHPLGEGETADGTGFGWQFQGGGIQKRSDGFYYLPVPFNGDVRLVASHEAGPQVKPGDPTPAVTTPLGPPIPPTIKQGATGEVVKQLQFLLSVEGYGLRPAQIDGSFGPTTTAAVKAFQQHNALGADGIVGPATWGVLLALDPVVSVAFPTTVVHNNRGLPVAKLQHTLNATRRWFGRGLAPLAEDGLFGPATDVLVRALQAWAHLGVDGVGDYKVWAASAGPSLWDVAGAHAPAQRFPIPPTVQQGSHGEPAQQAQFLLGNEGYGLAPWQADGDFGPDSKAAAERFQRANALTVDGVVGPATWKALFAHAPVAAHALPPTLRSGSSGPIVSLLQQTLNQARSRFGVTTAPLAVDGHFGPTTEAVVRTLQEWGSVIVDGIVSYRTWSVAIGPSLWSQ